VLFVCNAETLVKLACVRLPTQYRIDFKWYSIFSSNEAFLCLSTNAAVLVSIDEIRKKSIISEYSALKAIIDNKTSYLSPTEVTLPRHIPLFEKYISI
jgi:hypothetical protein